MKENYVIEASGLTKKFGDFTATNHITFQVHEGETATTCTGRPSR